MFIPPYYQNHDVQAAAAFIRKYPFATVISSDGNEIYTTLLPVIWDGDVLITHLAADNVHSRHLHLPTILLFRGPHGYVSPAWYSSPKNVPTWNYTLVRVEGTAGTTQDINALLDIQEKMISALEPSWLPQWHALDENYKNALLPHITGVYFRISKMEFIEKLNQNKPQQDQESVAGRLRQSENGTENELGKYMLDRLTKGEY